MFRGGDVSASELATFGVCFIVHRFLSASVLVTFVSGQGDWLFWEEMISAGRRPSNLMLVWI